MAYTTSSAVSRAERLIRVYKQTWRGPKLVGWQDDSGATYKTDWGPQGHPIRWAMDAHGRVYSLFEDLNSFIGWVTKDGTVWDEYGQPSKTSRGLGIAPVVVRGFQPGMAFKVGPDGAVYGRGVFGGTKLIGRVEGSSDLSTMGGLALLLLRDYD